MTPMGNYEPSPINEGVDNVRKGQFRREIPEKPQNTLRIIWMKRENCFAWK